MRHTPRVKHLIYESYSISLKEDEYSGILYPTLKLCINEAPHLMTKSRSVDAFFFINNLLFKPSADYNSPIRFNVYHGQNFKVGT